MCYKKRKERGQNKNLKNSEELVVSNMISNFGSTFDDSDTSNDTVTCDNKSNQIGRPINSCT